MNDISLNIFTNCTINAPDTTIIRKTYQSFKRTFDVDGNIPVTIWIDRHPRIKAYSKYAENIIRYFPKAKLMKCESLSDGYIQSIVKSKSKWLFMLEHDWLFNSELITDTLDGILTTMAASDIYHLRFNKRENIVHPPYDKFLKEHDCGIMKFCATPFLSNNPHIINRSRYLDFVRQGLIIRKMGSHGIEEVISKHQYTYGALYGGLDYPACVKHLDGRGK